jgi:hypothetical protein
MWRRKEKDGRDSKETLRKRRKPQKDKCLKLGVPFGELNS